MNLYLAAGPQGGNILVLFDVSISSHVYIFYSYTTIVEGDLSTWMLFRSH